MYEKELEASIKNALTQTWSHLVDLSNGVKKLGGGGVQIAGGEDEEDWKERQIEKRKRRGEKLVPPPSLPSVRAIRVVSFN